MKFIYYKSSLDFGVLKPIFILKTRLYAPLWSPDGSMNSTWLTRNYQNSLRNIQIRFVPIKLEVSRTPCPSALYSFSISTIQHLKIEHRIVRSIFGYFYWWLYIRRRDSTTAQWKIRPVFEFQSKLYYITLGAFYSVNWWCCIINIINEYNFEK